VTTPNESGYGVADRPVSALVRFDAFSNVIIEANLL